MEVLLRETVPSLGNRGQIVRVTDGYARNYLLPKKIALKATPGNKKLLEVERRTYEKKLLETKTVAEEAKARLEALSLEIPKRAADNNQLFGSVTRQEVAKLLNEKGYEVERRKIEMEHIREIGEYTAKLRLHPQVVAEIKISVSRVEE